MTTTGDPSIKSSSSLSSSDLVSRFLAATPPYLYNVPPMQHSFFFSEMLRSFVQAKNNNIPTNVSGIRRRKRACRDSHDRPLELTTKDKHGNQHSFTTHTSTSQCHDHCHQPQINHLPHQQLFHHQLMQEHPPPSSFVGTKFRKNNHTIHDSQEVASDICERGINNIKTNDEPNSFQTKSEQTKKYNTGRIPLNHQNEMLFPQNVEPVKPAEFQHLANIPNYVDNNFLQYCSRSPDNSFLSEQKNKLDLASKTFIPNVSNRIEEFRPNPNFVVPNSTGTDLLPNSFWYPPYSLTQNYPAIDPLHFFIDLRVSGHIWDRKSNEKCILNKNKHNSAFSVPQSKEYNRPLNLTRNECTITKYMEGNSRGTHYIFKNIKQTYKKISDSENLPRNDTTNEDTKKSMQSFEVQIIPNEEGETSNMSLDNTQDRKLDKGFVGLDCIVNN